LIAMCPSIFMFVYIYKLGYSPMVTAIPFHRPPSLPHPV
jgi:hypothetical protein